MRVLALLLSLFLSLPAGGLRLTLTAEKSDLLSAGALTGLQSLLPQGALTLSAAGCDVTYGGALLLAARPGALFTDDVSSSVSPETVPDLDALWAALEPWKEEKDESVNLQEAGKARSQAAYVLTAEEWESLGLTGAIAEKATFKRYFDGDGQPLGMYFYTSAMEIDGVTREVRMEYGCQPEKGLYLAFRCPDASQKNNLRINLHGKQTSQGWSLEGELRQVVQGETATYTIKGNTGGKLTLASSEKINGRTVKYTLTLDVDDGSAQYKLAKGEKLLLAGQAAWEAAELPERTIPEIEGDITEALANRLGEILRADAPETWQQVLHYLATNALVDAQKEGN